MKTKRSNELKKNKKTLTARLQTRLSNNKLYLKEMFLQLV